MLPPSCLFPPLSFPPVLSFSPTRHGGGRSGKHPIETAVIALFQDKFGRRPLPKDAPEFSSFLASALEKNGLPADFLGGESANAAAAAVCATATAEVSPVCAILGGILGQEVGDSCSASVCALARILSTSRVVLYSISTTDVGQGVLRSNSRPCR